MFYKFFNHVLVFVIVVFFLKSVIILLFLWGSIEIIIFSIKHRYLKDLSKFICSFVSTVLRSIDIICNVVLQVPANRILLTTTHFHTIFGHPNNSFFEVIEANLVCDNLTKRGKVLYNIIIYFKNTLT